MDYEAAVATAEYEYILNEASSPATARTVSDVFGLHDSCRTALARQSLREVFQGQ